MLLSGVYFGGEDMNKENPLIEELKPISSFNGKTVESCGAVRDRVLITFTDGSTMTVLAFDYSLSVVTKVKEA